MPLTWILVVLFGALLGWIAAVIVPARTGAQVMGLVGTGVIGALLGAVFITPPFAGRLAFYSFSLPGLLISLLGSILLLALLGFILRRLARRGPPSGA